VLNLFYFFQKKGKKKKDESEEGEISSNDEREEEFDDGLDEDLIGKQIFLFKISTVLSKFL
jgi:hypothetical protein